MLRDFRKEAMPSDLSGWWSLGSLVGLALVGQVITGLAVASRYGPDQAFWSSVASKVEPSGGWWYGGVHAAGAGAYLALMYLHVGRGLYYGSYRHPRGALWLLGALILTASLAVAFLGYTLVWGQMSLWAATVITNLASVVPLYGDSLVAWLWGGEVGSEAGLHRFTAWHEALGVLLVAPAGAHVVVLHGSGSTDPLGVPTRSDRVPFDPAYVYKDLWYYGAYGSLMGAWVGFGPDLGAHPDNWVPGDPLVTPAHIVPEFYFLPYYAILRAVPDKALGALAFGAAVAALWALGLYGSRAGAYGGPGSSLPGAWARAACWAFGGAFLALGYVGSKAPGYPYTELGQVASAAYFGYLGYLLAR